MLVFSRNKRMLRVQIERQTIIDEKVGIVFLTSRLLKNPGTDRTDFMGRR